VRRFIITTSISTTIGTKKLVGYLIWYVSVRIGGRFWSIPLVDLFQSSTSIGRFPDV
jgi:hypothetical protein